MRLLKLKRDELIWVTRLGVVRIDKGVEIVITSYRYGMTKAFTIGTTHTDVLLLSSSPSPSTFSPPGSTAV